MTSTQIRAIGSDGLRTSPLGIGCMGMASESYGRADADEAVATLLRAFEVGINFLDTSDIYGPYTSELIVGRALKVRREGVVVGTKFGIVPSGPDSPITGGNAMGINGSPNYVRASCDASLHRLGIDRIDIYYVHRLDPKVPIEETIGALSELVAAGKVAHIGLSEISPGILERAHKVHPISAVQAEYSLWSRDIEDDVLPAARRLGVGIVAYSPLGRGFLSGRIRSLEDLDPDDYRRVNPRFQGDNFVKNLKLLGAVNALAGDIGCTPAQLALAWVLAQGNDIVAIPGAETRAQLEENAVATSIRLTADQLADIEAAFPREAVAGERYPQEHMPYTG